MKSPSKYRITSSILMQTISNWDSLMNFRVRLVGCGGTALTLLNIKESTKDIDLIVPVHTEYKRMMKFLSDIGYREIRGSWSHPDDPYFLYQFWCGNRVFTTDLLDSPLESGKHIAIKRFRHIYLGALNLVDLIITKMFRGTSIDIDDCIAVFATRQVDADRLLERYSTASLYDLNPEKMMQNFIFFVEELASRNLVNEEFLEKVREYR